MTGNLFMSMIGIAIVCGAVFFVWWTKFRKVVPAFTVKSLLSKGEQEFFLRLCKALPTHYVFPQIAMLALLEPRESKRIRNGEEFRTIAQETIDFAIYDHLVRLICVVELVDQTFVASSEPAGGRYLNDAGIKRIRWDAANKPSAEQIAKTILPMEHQTLSRQSTASKSLPKADAPSQSLPDTVLRMREADPVPSNIQGLTAFALDQLTPRKVLQKNYPHIWQRVTAFAAEPKHLQKYLLSLSLQDRGGKRAGFSLEALQEIANIQMQNDQFILRSVPGWQPSFINL